RPGGALAPRSPRGEGEGAVGVRSGAVHRLRDPRLAQGEGREGGQGGVHVDPERGEPAPLQPEAHLPDVPGQGRGPGRQVAGPDQAGREGGARPPRREVTPGRACQVKLFTWRGRQLYLARSPTGIGEVAKKVGDLAKWMTQKVGGLGSLGHS